MNKNVFLFERRKKRVVNMIFNHEQNVCHVQNVFQEDHQLNLFDQHRH